MNVLQSSSVKILEEDLNLFKKRLRDFGYELNRGIKRTVVNWENVSNSYAFFYDYTGNENEIRELLMSTDFAMNESDKVFIELGPNNPVILVDKLFFIDKWLDFVAENGYMGITVITENGNFLMEFTDDTDFLLYSNFKIKSG